MPYFKVKLHQIRFTALPQTSHLDLRGLLLRGGRGRGGEREGRKG